MDYQDIIVILVGIGCLLWIGVRIYRSFKSVGGNGDPCANCPTGCELHQKLQEKRRTCEKKSRRKQKKLLRIVGDIKICTTFATAKPRKQGLQKTATKMVP